MSDDDDTEGPALAEAVSDLLATVVEAFAAAGLDPDVRSEVRDGGLTVTIDVRVIGENC